MTASVEMRCPAHPARLLGKVNDPHIVDGNLIEFACDWCKEEHRRHGHRVRLVLHRYNVLGDLIESETIDG